MIIITKKIHRARLVAGFIMLVLTIGFVGAGLGLVRDIRETEALSVTQMDAKGVKTNLPGKLRLAGGPRGRQH